MGLGFNKGTFPAAQHTATEQYRSSHQKVELSVSDFVFRRVIGKVGAECDPGTPGYLLYISGSARVPVWIRNGVKSRQPNHKSGRSLHLPFPLTLAKNCCTPSVARRRIAMDLEIFLVAPMTRIVRAMIKYCFAVRKRLETLDGFKVLMNAVRLECDE
jgi:hypothetical protein